MVDIFTFIKKNQITVFSKTWCPYCTKAKNLLRQNNLNFKVYEIDLGQISESDFKAV